MAACRGPQPHCRAIQADTVHQQVCCTARDEHCSNMPCSNCMVGFCCQTYRCMLPYWLINLQVCSLVTSCRWSSRCFLVLQRAHALLRDTTQNLHRALYPSDAAKLSTTRALERDSETIVGKELRNAEWCDLVTLTACDCTEGYLIHDAKRDERSIHRSAMGVTMLTCQHSNKTGWTADLTSAAAPVLVGATKIHAKQLPPVPNRAAS